MNFLAHCALAHDAAEHWQVDASARTALLAGAVIGDFIKGPVPDRWPADLRAGVRLHRRIDAITAREASLSSVFPAFGSSLRRYAPILLDLLCDYSLCRQWHHFYEFELPQFSQECYAALTTYQAYLPSRGQRFSQYLQQEDLLTHYDQWHVVSQGTGSVLRRLGMESRQEEVMTAMHAAREATDQAMQAAYPRLQNAWMTWRPMEYQP